MKLRSFSVIVLLALGAIGVTGIKLIKRDITRRFNKNIKHLVQEEASKIEKKLTKKYDLADWDDDIQSDDDIQEEKRKEAETTKNHTFVDFNSPRNVVITNNKPIVENH